MHLYRYPDGSTEGIVFVPRGAPSTEHSWWAALSVDERHALNRQRVGRRASQQVRRLVRTADLRRLLTFTNGGEGDGFASMRDAMKCWRRWYHEHGHLLGDTSVVAVAELGGKRGRIHLHAAIRSGYRLPYSLIIASWSSTLESLGYRSKTGTHAFWAGDDRHKGHRLASARVCGGYMAGYIAKGFGDLARLEQERRYAAFGVTCLDPRRIAGFTLHDVPSLVADTFGTDVTPYEDGEGRLAGYWFDSG